MPAFRNFLAAVFALYALLSSAVAQEGAVLKYQFQKDQPVTYRTTSEMAQTMQIAGQTVENKITQTEVNSVALQQVTPEGSFKLKYANQKLAINADMGPAGTYKFDSESSEREKGTALSNQLNPVYETMAGVEYSIIITPRGKVEKVEGYKEVLENILKDNPIAAQITGGGSEEALKAGLAEVFVVLPDKPVQEGASWEVPFELEFPKIGKAEGKRVYRFEGYLTKDNTRIARISVSTEASFDFDLEMGGAKITGHIGTDSSKGDIRFDTEKGEMISANLEYTMSGTISTTVGERTFQTSIKQTQKRSTQQANAPPN